MSIGASPSPTAAAAEEMLAAAGAATAEADAGGAATAEREPTLDDERDKRLEAELGGEPGVSLGFTRDRARTGEDAKP